LGSLTHAVGIYEEYNEKEKSGKPRATSSAPSMGTLHVYLKDNTTPNKPQKT